jgi:hypothetical protein
VVYATQFPDNVGRMVLDGVVETEAYFAGNISASFLQTDEAIGVFFQSCFEAGPERCAFYDSSPEKISANLDAIYEQLKVAPMAAFDAKNYGIVDYGLLRALMRSSAYFPTSSFGPLADALALLSNGNASAVFSLGNLPLVNSPCNCSGEDPTTNGFDAFVSIWCNDAVTFNNTVEEWQEYYEEAASVSAYADVWAGTYMRCSYVLSSSLELVLTYSSRSWPVKTKNPVRGPWGGNTSTPILFIGNTIGKFMVVETDR